jgi:predicted DNA-binding transcriptional regulator YafY
LQLYFKDQDMPTTDYKRDERLQVIHKCLANTNRRWTIQLLLDTVNDHLAEIGGKPVSARTLADDLKYLEERKFAPIEMVREGRRIFYRYSEHDFELNRPLISRDQFLSLAVGKEVLKNLQGFPLAKDLEKIVASLEHQIDSSRPENYPLLIFDSPAGLKNIGLLQDLFECIREETVLKIQYQHFKADAPSEKIIHPYFLKQYNQRWFLFGFDSVNNRLDNSPLDRIVGFRPVSLPFIPNTRYRPDEYFRDVIGVTRREGEEPEEVIFRVCRERAKYVLTKPLLSSQKVNKYLDNGDIEFSVCVVINLELVSLILSFGKDVIVQQPQRLRGLIYQELMSACKNYEP